MPRDPRRELSELTDLPVLGPNPADGAAGRAHDHGFCFDHIAVELHAAQHAAVGYASRGKQALALDHVLDLIFAAWVFDPHFGRALALLFGIEHEPRLHLATDATQRRRRQHTLRRATNAEIDIDAGLVRIGGVDDAGDVAIAY